MPASVGNNKPGTSPPGAAVSLMIFGVTNGSSSETINYTGAAISPPTGFTIFDSNATKTAANAGTQPAGPNKSGWISAVLNAGDTVSSNSPANAYGTRMRCTMASVAAGTWTVKLDSTSTGLLGPTIAIGVKVWQVSADLLTATQIQNWTYGATFTAAQSAYTITFNPGAVTLSSSTPHLYIEFCLNVTSGGTNLTANAITVTNVRIESLPSIGYARDPSVYSTETTTPDTSSNHLDATIMGIDGPNGVPTFVSSFLGAGFGNAMRTVTTGGANNPYSNMVCVGSNPLLNQTGPFTVEIRVKPASTATGVVSVARWNRSNDSVAGQNHWQIQSGTGPKFSAVIMDNTDVQRFATDSANFTSGTAYALALDWDGTTLRLYRDGAVVGSTACSSIKAYSSLSAPMTIGGGNASPQALQQAAAGAFPGDIDEVRFSNISRYGGASYTPSSSPLTADANTVGLWQFESTASVNTSQVAASSDAITRVFTGARTNSETLSAAVDAVTRLFTANRSLSETLSAASAAVSRSTSTQRTISETISAASEAVSRVFVGARTISETIAASSAVVTRILNALRTVSETISAPTAVVTRVFVANRSLSETVSAASDTESRQVNYHRTLSETISSAAETVTRVFVANRLINEAVATGTTIIKKILYLFDD